MPVDNLGAVAEFQNYIYPEPVSTRKVECGCDKPYYTVIDSEDGQLRLHVSLLIPSQR